MKNKILCLSPHTDDCELGLGGTMAKFIEEGDELFYVAFSSAEKSVPEGLPKDTLVREVRKALEVFGIDEDHFQLLKYETRVFPEYRQQILDDMIEMNRVIQPNIVFLPSTFDNHQDHQVICDEGFRAFKKTSIFGYELPWNNCTFRTDLFVRLEERHLEKKIKALSGYQSQSKKLYMSPEFTRSLAITRGAPINVPFAESFEIIRFNL